MLKTGVLLDEVYFFFYESLRATVSNFFTFVSSGADTDGLLGVLATVTSSGKLPQAVRAVGTHTGTTVIT